MGFLERAIRRGVRDGVSNAVSKALQPTVNRIADQATTAAQQYADEVGKSIKICPSCGEGQRQTRSSAKNAEWLCPSRASPRARCAENAAPKITLARNSAKAAVRS